MEPQINYGSYQNQNPIEKQKVYGRSFGGGGCLKIIGPAILLVIIIIISIIFAYPALTPNTIHGDFMDMTIVPQKDGSQKLWILTDGSFTFIQTTKSPGSYSSGVKCYACKTWTYIYDPATEKILKKIKIEQQDVITHIDIIYNKGKIWVITGGYHENEPKIAVFDAETTEPVMDTKGFINKYPALSGGLDGVRYDEKEGTIVFKTKDGKDQVTYDIESEKIYDIPGEYDKVLSNSREPGYIAVLNPDKSAAARKRLFKVSGLRGKLNGKKSTLEHFTLENDILDKRDSLTAERLTDKSFLEGIIYYQDNDCAIIIHLDQIGRKSNRMMTCVDLKTGRENWTIQQEDLFKRMKIDQDADSFSDLFFTKDKIKVRRSGNLVVLELKGEGLMGFDYDSGKKLWTLDI